ncbi:MAG: zinc-ribbon domain-containing protein [Planctomycetes bacterium]|nr:zinc-ribbon domain-containing protein [Planctomycetota bacterium]
MSQPVLVSCPGCDTQYDVSRREPGRRMRCPRCRGVVVVPERKPEASASPQVTASSRLRRARGPACARHPRRTAEGRCAGCGAHACAACWAPAPVDHFCARCAEERHLGGALPIDFGLLATPRLAMTAMLGSLGRLVGWTAFSVLATFTVFALPIVLSGLAFQVTYDGQATWLTDLLAAVFVAASVGMLLTHFLFLVPAGCAVFLDHAIRGRRLPLGEAFREAWWRFLASAPRLLGVLVVVALLFLPFAVLVLGAAWVVNAGAGPLPALLLVLGGLSVGLLPIFTVLGLAVPVVVLEERSAHAALARAWELVRGHLASFGLLVVAYFVVVVVLGSVLGAVGAVTGLRVPLGVLSQLIDVLLWPSLLVAAYHGLSAEQAGVLGRK